MDRFKVISGQKRVYYYISSFLYGLKYWHTFKNIDKYVIFIGYPRSGHSMIGSLLDAHPDMVISNQLNALYFFQQNYFKHQIFYLILKNARNYAEKGRSNSGYNYQVNNQWQGKYRQLKVIGDKRGGSSSQILGQDGDSELIHRIGKKTTAEIKFIHVIRNPYDNISTMILRKMRKTDVPFSKVLFEEKLNLYFQKAAANHQIIKNKKHDVCNIYLEDFIASPTSELKKICDFLEVEATNDYLKNCEELVWKKPNLSREKVTFWTPENIESVAQKIGEFQFLDRFTFNE